MTQQQQQQQISLLPLDTHTLTSLSDITIQLSDSSFKSHKLILSLYSTYFKHLFTFSPSQTSFTLPNDISPLTYTSIHNWFYTQTITYTSFDEAFKIINACNYLGIHLLLSNTFQYIETNITCNNALHVFRRVYELLQRQMQCNNKQLTSIIKEIFINKESINEHEENCALKCLGNIIKFICDNVFNVICDDIIGSKELFMEVIGKELYYECFIHKILHQLKTAVQLDNIMMIIRESYINKNTLSDLIEFNNNNNINETNYKCSFTFSLLSNDNHLDNTQPYITSQSILISQHKWIISLEKSFLGNLYIIFRHCGYGTSSSIDNIIQTITLHYQIQIQFHNENNPLSSFICDKLITNNNLSMISYKVKICSHNDLINNPLTINISVYENITHSAVIDYLSINFGKITLNELACISYDTLFSIIKNDLLFIENEYTLLQYVIDILHIKDTQYEQTCSDTVLVYVKIILHSIRICNITNTQLLELYKQSLQKHFRTQSVFDVINAFFKHEIQKRLSDNEDSLNEYDYGNDMFVNNYYDDEMFYESKEYSLYIDELVYNLNQRRKYMKEWKCTTKSGKERKKEFVSDIKSFLLVNGVDVDINKCYGNVEKLVEKNKTAINKCCGFVKEIAECIKCLKEKECDGKGGWWFTNNVPLSKIKDSKIYHIKKQIRELQSNTFVVSKLNDLKEDILLLSEELKN